MTDQLIKKQEFRWSYQKKGTHVLNVCTRLLFLFSFAAGLVSGTTQALANPAGGNVVGGAATITNTAAELQIHQSSQKALIEWSSFDIAAGETTRFYQPNAKAVALNRVVNSTQLSTINGNLIANGHVLVINPNGVLIGKTGKVDTAGFIASSADIGNDAFMNGTGVLNFNIAGKADASVVNEGTVTVADEGLAAFVAPSVRNDGVIAGNLSKIHLGAGDTFGVDLYGDGLINLAVQPGAGARTIKTENNGSLISNGGQVLMTAAAANEVVKSVINNTGVVQAQGLVNHNGEIILTGPGADVKVAGTLDASGANGGGSIKIGGDYQGGGTLAHADTVYVAADATLDASATDNGLGGLIVVWANKINAFFGAAFAKGGANGGSGGTVETSTDGYLSIAGAHVDTTAAGGAAGTWLLDPADVVIRGGNGDGSDTNTFLETLLGGANNSLHGSSDGTVSYTTGSGTFTIYESEIEGQSAWTNIVIQATHGITTVAGGDNTVTLAANRDLTIQTRNNTGAESATGAGIDLSNLAFATSGNGAILVQASTGTGAGNVKVGKLTSELGDISLVTDNGSVTATGDIASSNGIVTLTSGNGGAISTKNITINSGSGGFSTLNVNAAGTLTVDGNITVSNDDDFALTDHSTASATLAAQGDVSITGNVTVSSRDHQEILLGSTSTLAISSANGGINIGGAVTASSDTVGNRLFGLIGDGPTAVTNLSVAAKNDIVIGGAVAGTATAVASLNDDVSSATVSITSSNGGLWLAGAAPKAQADGALEQQAYTGAAYDHTTKKDSNTDVARLVLSGKKYTLNVTADGKTKVYGEADPALTYSYTGALLHGDTFTGALTRVSGKNVGSYAINQGTLLAGVNYNIVYTGANLVITPATLTVKAASDTKVYDGNTSSDEAPVFEGLVTAYGDTASAVQTFDSRNAGARTLSVGTVTINDGNGGNNYTVVKTAAAGEITKADLVIGAVSDTKVYDGTTSSSKKPVVVSGLVSGDTVTNTSEAFASKNVLGTNGSTLVVTGYKVNDGNGGNNYSVTTTTATGTITPAKLTISAVTDGKIYDATTSSDETPTVGGLKTGDSVTGRTQAFESKNVKGLLGSKINVTGYTVNDGNGGNNYTVTTKSSLGTILPAGLLIAAESDTKTYDGTTISTVTPTVYGLKGEDNVTDASQAFLSKNVYGTNHSVLYVNGYTVNDGNGGHNYIVVTSLNLGTINPASLTLAARSDTKIYDATTDSDEDVKVTGLVAGDSIDNLSQSYTSKNVKGFLKSTLRVDGSYVVNDGNGGRNYVVTVKDAKGTIIPAPLLIAAKSDSKVYDGTTSSDETPDVYGLKGDDSVTGTTQAFLSKDVKGAYHSILYVNGYTLNDGNEGHNYVVVKTPNLGTISPAELLVTLNNDSKIYNGVAYAGGNGYTFGDGEGGQGFVNGETADVLGGTLVYGGSSQGAVNAGIYGITGTGLTSSNYHITYVSGTLVVGKKGLTIIADPQKKLIGTADPVLTYTTSGLVEGDESLISLYRDPGETVGKYAIHLANGGGKLQKLDCEGECSFSPLLFQNYDVTYVGNFLVIGASGSQAQAMFDTLSRPTFSVAGKVIDFDPSFEPREVTVNPDMGMRSTNTQQANNDAQNLANIEPAAGDDDDATAKKKGKKHAKYKLAWWKKKDKSPENLANIEPAAGGSSSGQGPNGGAFSCANDFLDGKACAQ